MWFPEKCSKKMLLSFCDFVTNTQMNQMISLQSGGEGTGACHQEGTDLAPDKIKRRLKFKADVQPLSRRRSRQVQPHLYN